MRTFLSVLTAVSWITSVWALHASEAGVVDWHKTFIGVPQTDNLESSPVFHRIETRNSTRSVVLTSTENTNVLAALDPVNGSVVWRYIFESRDPILSFHKHGNVVAALSGVGGSNLRLFDSLEGDLIWERRLHDIRVGHLSQPKQLGTSITFLGDGNLDMLVLTNGHTLYRLNGATGERLWTWTSPDQSSLVIYDQLLVSDSIIYAIGLAKSFASYTLHVTALSSATGDLLTTADIPSNIVNGLRDLFPLSHTGVQNPSLVWLEDDAIKYLVLTPKLESNSTSVSSSGYEKILDVGLGDKGMFVAHRVDGSSYVFRLESGKIEQTWEFTDSASSNRLTNSLYAGGVDKEGNPYVGRLYWSHSHQAASLHIYAPHLRDGKGIVTGFTFPFETNQHGIINHFALDVVNPEGLKVLARVALTTSTGTVQLWLDDKVQWTREEGLSGILLAEFVELPEKKTMTSSAGEDGETFMQRLLRQASDAQNFPQYLISFAKRFATGSYASVISSASADSSGSLYRDEFGFKKIIVAANRYGKIYGLDSSNGRVVWSRILSLGLIARVGGSIEPIKMFVTRAVTDGDAPQVVLVAERRGHHGTTDTVIFHFDPMTGEDVLGVSVDGDVLQGVDIFTGPLLEAYMWESGKKIIVLIDESRQVHLYPNTAEDREALDRVTASLSYSIKTSDHELQGFQVLPSSVRDGPLATYSTWSLSVPQSELVHSITRAPNYPIASFGKVLGNRTTLYKYLNQHLFAVTTVPRLPTSGSCSIYLLDGIKGSIIYHAVVADKGSCSIEAVLTENWLVYSYYDNEYAGVGQSKGHRVISVELYEGNGIDEKTRSLDMTSFSNKTLEVFSHERAYQSSSGISTMASTSTKFGITTKNIIVATRNNQIQSIPRVFLDPRRPKDKPSAQEQEEMLIQYDPNLPANPQHIISHNYEVANTRKIITSPALLESTSLVFAFGIDLFFSRIAPSNTFDVLSENFNKLQLVLTVGGLAVAIIISRPMVHQKWLREKWYQ